MLEHDPDVRRKGLAKRAHLLLDNAAECAAFAQHCLSGKPSPLDTITIECHGSRATLFHQVEILMPRLLAFAQATAYVMCGEPGPSNASRPNHKMNLIFDDGKEQSVDSILDREMHNRPSFVSALLGNRGTSPRAVEAIIARTDDSLRRFNFLPQTKQLAHKCAKRLNLLCEKATKALGGVDSGSRRQMLESEHARIKADIEDDMHQRATAILERACSEMEHTSESEGTRRPACVVTGFRQQARPFNYHWNAQSRGETDYIIEYAAVNVVEEVPHTLFLFRNRLDNDDSAQRIARKIHIPSALQPNQSLLSAIILKNQLVSFVREEGGSLQVFANDLRTSPKLWDRRDRVATIKRVIDMVEIDPATLTVAIYSSQDGGRIERFRVDDAGATLKLEHVGNAFVLDGSVWNLGFDKLRSLKFIPNRDELLLFGDNDTMRVVDLRSDKLKPAKHGWFTLDEAGFSSISVYYVFVFAHISVLILCLPTHIRGQLRVNSLILVWVRSTLTDGSLRQPSRDTRRHVPVCFHGHERDGARAVLHQRRRVLWREFFCERGRHVQQ